MVKCHDIFDPKDDLDRATLSLSLSLLTQPPSSPLFTAALPHPRYSNHGEEGGWVEREREREKNEIKRKNDRFGPFGYVYFVIMYLPLPLGCNLGLMF